MRRTVQLGVGVVGFLAVVGILIAAITSSAYSSSAANSTPAAPTAPPRPSNIPPVLSAFQTPPPPPTLSAQNGAPAIKPSNASTNPAVPAFTTADVTTYFAGRTWIGSPLTIAKVSFMTVHDVNASGAIGLRFADDQLVCLVHLTGTFDDHGTQRTNMYQVFDAHTGNLLGWSFR